MTLYEISSDLLALGELLAEVGGEITNEEAEAALDEWFSELGNERDTKIDAYCQVIKEYEARCKARDEEAERLIELARTDANKVRRLRDRLMEFFQVQEIRRLETQRFRISLANNGGVQQVRVLCDPEMLDAEYRLVNYAANIKAIRARLEAGEKLQFAMLMPRGQHLSIR